MKNILSMADLHGRLPKLPKNILASDVDILMLGGDICGHSAANWTWNDYFQRMVNVPAEAAYQKDWLKNTLKPWIDKKINPKHIVFVNGNHDFGDFSGVFEHYLFQGSKTIEVEGIKIGLLAGSGILVNEWNDEINEDQFSQRIEGIDRDIEMLLSHMPPYGILDKAYSGDRIGSMALTKAIFGSAIGGQDPYFTHLTHHFFGHAHEARGHQDEWVDERRISFNNVAETFCTLETHKGSRTSFHSK